MRNKIEDILGIELTPTQREYFNAIDWLLDSNTPIERAVGKTYLMSVIFIKTAIEHPNRWIYVFDHIYPWKTGNPYSIYEQVRDLISGIVTEEHSNFECSDNKKAIKYLGRP